MERRLTTILAADVVGYSRLMGADEAGTLATLKAHRADLLDPKTAQHGGRVIKLMGDGILMEFASVVDAVSFAIDVQHGLKILDDGAPGDRQILYRIGINIGDVIVEDDDIYGDGVNVAARLEGLAEAGGVCIGLNVRDQIRDRLDLNLKDLGEVEVKNIARPVRAFQIVMDDKAGALSTPVVRASAQSMRPSRKGIAAVMAALLLVVSGAAVWWQQRLPEIEPARVEAMALPLPDKPSIAVLPFNNMSEDASQEYFADGMTEDLITDLSKISGLFVIARNSSFSYKGQQVKIRKVAEELGVRYVLEGSVRRAGDEVRINAQLIDATTGGHLWAERYDGKMEDVFKLQDRVTEQIVAALAISLTGKEQAKQALHDTENVAAHDAFLQGWAHYKLLTRAAFKSALPFLKEAVRLDPDYAQAHAALATVYWDAYKNDWAFDIKLPSFDAESLANEHLEKALKSPTPLTHALQSRIFATAGLHSEAVKEAEKAVALDGNNATAQAGLANALVLAERPAEAIEPIRFAMRLDPHHPPSYLITLGAALFGLERYKQAASTFERAVKRNPDNERPLIYLASSYGHLGQIKDADNAIEAANIVRGKLGIDVLTLGKKKANFTTTPFRGEIDFPSFGGNAAQKRLRTGLTSIPALTWQFRITTHEVLGAGNTWYDVEGATLVDIQAAKALHDRGAIFIDMSPRENWINGHVPRAINLPFYWRSNDPDQPRLTEKSLMAVADKNSELVVYCKDRQTCSSGAWGAAKAANWGYQTVYYFRHGADAWMDAGYPVETGQ